MKASTYSDTPSFGNTLKALANLSGCTYRSIASQLNYSPSLIGKWVSGETRPREAELNVILEKITNTIYTSAATKDRIVPLYEFLGLSPDLPGASKEAVPLLTRILSEAYYHSLNASNSRVMPHYHFYHSPEDLLSDLIDSLRGKVRLNPQHSLRIFSNLDLCKYKNSVPQMENLFDLLGPCDFHQVLDMPDFNLKLMQCLSVNLLPFLDRGGLNRTYYSFGFESSSIHFVFIEDTGILLELPVAGDLFYQWVPAPHHTAFLSSRERHAFSPENWQPILRPCEDPDFETHLLNFSWQEKTLLTSVNYGHFMLAMHPKSHTIPMPRPGQVYLRFLRNITDNRQARCVFHIDDGIQDTLRYLSENYLDIPVSDLAATLQENWSSTDNNHYFFSSEENMSLLQENSFWIMTHNTALLILVDPRELVPSHYFFIEGEAAEAHWRSVLSRTQLQEPFIQSAEALMNLLPN